MSAQNFKRIRFANTAGFLVWDANHFILIDTGYKNTIHKFHEAIEEMGISADDICLIILTHTHFDHAGGAAELQQITGAPIAVHRSEADYLRRGKTIIPNGTRWKGKLIALAGRIFGKRKVSYPPANPDILIDDEMDLSAFGIRGKVIHTPGHTLGSVSVILDDGIAFVGDNVLGVSSHEYFPPFASDKKGVIESWEKYIQHGVTMVFPAHGRRVSIDSLRKEMPLDKKKYIRESYRDKK